MLAASWSEAAAEALRSSCLNAELLVSALSDGSSAARKWVEHATSASACEVSAPPGFCVMKSWLNHLLHHSGGSKVTSFDFDDRHVLIRRSASVTVDDMIVSSIGPGVLALVGLCKDDGIADLKFCANKLCCTRLWDDADGKQWRKGAASMGYEVLLVSQFTLYGDVSNKKHVPDYSLAMKNAQALQSFDIFCELVKNTYGDEDKVKTGQFGAMMDIALVNDGPVTVVVDSQGASLRRMPCV